MFLGRDKRGETAAIYFSIPARAKRHQIEPFAYVRDLLIAMSSDHVDWNSLLPDVWIAAHPEHVLKSRRDEAEAAASSRRRRRAFRREKAKAANPGWCRVQDGGAGVTRLRCRRGRGSLRNRRRARTDHVGDLPRLATESEFESTSHRPRSRLARLRRPPS